MFYFELFLREKITLVSAKDLPFCLFLKIIDFATIIILITIGSHDLSPNIN